jgi:hypothetical protein
METVARLPLGVGTIERVSALTTLARPEANAVEMAVGIAPADADDPAELIASLGDWVRLGPLEWAECHASSDLSADTAKVLLVASRMANTEDSSAWAWASVARLELL